MSKIEIIDGGALPEELGAALLGVLSKGDDAIMKAATKEQLVSLLEGADQPKLKVGDIVVLREHALNNYKWPVADEQAIVTQALDTPYRCGDSGTPRSGKRLDIALAFIDPDDGRIHEFLHDSRNFKKVGSIHD